MNDQILTEIELNLKLYLLKAIEQYFENNTAQHSQAVFDVKHEVGFAMKVKL